MLMAGGGIGAPLRDQRGSLMLRMGIWPSYEGARLGPFKRMNLMTGGRKGGCRARRVWMMLQYVVGLRYLMSVTKLGTVSSQRKTRTGGTFLVSK